ncbi:MAG: LptF/LptG family permease [Chitinophagaceae bacterium]
MIKKLDILVLRSFIGPFLATFLISLFVLILQFFWLYIDDLVGKGLDLGTLGYLTSLVAVTWVPLALPLALLLSSIMAFGKLGETFELVAIKSAGVPLIRFMRPVFIVTILLSIVAFFFANNIIPVANLKLNTVKYDIFVAKPAFDIKEGVFYDKLEGYIIKIGKKDKDDSTIRNVIIWEKTFGLQDNFMTAESGIMSITPDKKFLRFTLHNGWNYQENGNRYNPNTEFIRLGFKDYIKEFDLSSFKMNKSSDTAFKDNPQMLSIRQLNHAIDSLGDIHQQFAATLQKQAAPYLSFLRLKDSTWPNSNSIRGEPISTIIPDTLKTMVFNRTIAQMNSTKSYIDLLAVDYKSRLETERKYWIEWNRKFTLSAACIVLFLIGAPLGSIIRRGGLGTPLVFAIVFFVLFNMLNTFGEKFAKEGVTSPFTGMWLSAMVLVPIGLFLTLKAMRDSQLFNKEYYFRFARRLKEIAQKTGLIKNNQAGK